MDHPLQQTLLQVEGRSGYIKAQLGVPEGAEWVAAAALFAPGSAHLQQLTAAAKKQLRTGTVNMIGSTLLQNYQWATVSSAIACYLLDRRVPDLDPTNVRLLLTEQGKIGRVAFVNGRFAALPDDPAAANPDATVVADVAELRDHLRRGLERHLGHAIDQLHQGVGSSLRGLWLVVADRCADDLAWLMQMQDPTTRMATIEAEVKALLRPASPLFNKKVALFELTYQAQTQTYAERVTCCYWYKLEDGSYCTTCPHRPKPERDALLIGYMAEAQAQAA